MQSEEEIYHGTKTVRGNKVWKTEIRMGPEKHTQEEILPLKKAPIWKESKRRKAKAQEQWQEYVALDQGTSPLLGLWAKQSNENKSIHSMTTK